jgi:peptidoglycan hydrolase-like protein with peptidoglycan-binding domain
MASNPHRLLRLTSPLTRGPDVFALQAALNKRLRARDLSPVDVDGEYGPATAAAVERVGYLLGLLKGTLARGGTVGVQRIIRNPRVRTPGQRARAAHRKSKQGEPGPTAALAFARSKIGVKEHPAGSNTGPQIRDWQKAAGMGPGPWCGAFVKASADAGGARVTPEARYTPWIEKHAKAKTGGYEGWCLPGDDLAKPGDHVVFDWQPGTGADHTGVLESVDRQARTVTCIEGNTSGSGSQDNGGAVLRKTRPFSQVRGVARVRWPK